MRVTMIVLAGLFGFTSMAQLSSQEAGAKLAEREALKKLERDQSVTITAGELADLRNRVKQLEGEVSLLRGKPNIKDKVAPKPLPIMIEIGMTKAEVLAFVRRNKGLQIAGMSADAGVQRSSEQVIVRKSSSDDKSESIAKNDDDPNRTRTQNDANGNSKVEVETVRMAGMRETIRVQKIENHQVVTGSHTGGFGGTEYFYANEVRVTGTIAVTLTDGIVTSVNAQ